VPLLYTASFYTPEHWIGRLYRVSRSHPRGTKAQWETLPFFYPKRDLLRAYRGGGMDFAGFELEYTQGLTRAYYEVSQLREWLRAVPSLGDFTLLCFERFGEPCHRLALARWLLERVPSLELGALR
jgi:hypothetical protein